MKKSFLNQKPNNENIESLPQDDGFAVDLEVFIVDFFKGLKRFWWVCVALAVIAAPLSFLRTLHSYTPMYQSAVTFAITTRNSTYNTNGTTTYDYIYNQATVTQMQTVFPVIIQNPLMTNIIANDLGVPFVNGMITANIIVEGANLFQITVTSPTAQDAYNIVRSVMENYPQVAEYVIGDTKLSVVSEPEIPTAPVAEFTWARQVVIAIVAGVFAGLMLIAVYAFFKKTVKRKADIKEKLNYECIAEIPAVRVRRSRKDSEEKHMVVVDKRNPLFSEAFRSLRKRVLTQLDRDGKKAVAVTSAAVAEGKSTVSFNLAFSIATAGKKVALLDLDLRRKSMQQYIKGNDTPLGLTNVVAGEATLEEIDYQHEQSDNLHIYFAGSKKNKFNENDFTEIFAKLREQYDYIVVDTPPCGIVSDAAAIADMADCILFVVRQDTATISKIKSAIEYVCFSRAKILGFVFNGVEAGFTGYGSSYYGGYGYYGRRYGGYYGKRYGYGKGYGYGNKGYGYGYGGYGYGYGYGEGEGADEKIWTSEFEE